MLRRKKLLYAAIDNGDLAAVNRQLRAAKALQYYIPLAIGKAILANQYKILTTLVRAGVPINSGRGYAVVVAAQSTLSTLHMVLRTGGNPNARDGYAIKRAAMHGELDKLKLLMEYNANPNIDGGAALELAREHNQPETVTYLESLLTVDILAEVNEGFDTI